MIRSCLLLGITVTGPISLFEMVLRNCKFVMSVWFCCCDNQKLFEMVRRN